MKAQEMFELLGFKKTNNNPTTYIKDDGGYITKYLFSIATRMLQITEYEEYNNRLPQGGTCMFVEYIKAIHQQMKELQWIDETSKPLLLTDKDFDIDVSSHLCCPQCKQPIVNVWSNIEYKPKYCHYCGQGLEW